MSLTVLFLAAFGLGLVFNAAPGAVFAETVRQGLRGGFRPALAVQLGSLVGDTTWALLGLTGVGVLLQLDALRAPIAIASAVYLLWLSWDSWKAARIEYSVPAPGAQARRRAFRAGALLSLTNPQNLAYWAAIGTAMGSLGIEQPRAQDYAVFFAGLMAASVLWCFVCAAIVDRMFRRVGAAWARFTYRLCAAVLLGLALSALRDLVSAREPGAPTPPAATATR